MGLANIVPGVSGGTMVLALGMYEHFINAVADVTRPSFFRSFLRLDPWLRLVRFDLRGALRAVDVRSQSLVVLGTLGFLVVATIVLLSSVVSGLMEHHRPEMLGLFIGMTLGGAPTLLREMRPMRASGVMGAAVGFIIMAAAALLLVPGFSQPSWAFLFVGGLVGSAAMILPGISGSYMLLVMGIYTPILFGISEFKDALRGADVALLLDRGMGIILPVGLGVVIGIAALSNILKWLLSRYHQPTLGVLLGLLLGSVIGLYPFQNPSFEKLVRYAVPPAEANAKAELRIMGFGWAADDALMTSLLAPLESPGTTVRIISAAPASPTSDDLAVAREQRAVVITRDVEVSRQFRREAGHKDRDAGIREVELVILPNMTATPPRAAVVVMLGLLGAAITLGLGRLEQSKAA